MYITKIKEGHINVPIVPEDKIFKQGLYILVYKGKVIKVGIYGEGVDSNNKSRFAAYRNMGKNIVNKNGSYKTMKVLNEKLNVGERIEVRFKEVPTDYIEKDGFRYKVDLYYEEDKLKDKYKKSLWLS